MPGRAGGAQGGVQVRHPHGPGDQSRRREVVDAERARPTGVRLLRVRADDLQVAPGAEAREPVAGADPDVRPALDEHDPVPLDRGRRRVQVGGGQHEVIEHAGDDSPVSPHRTLVLGGTRSGKSGHAEALFAADEPVRYAATARRIAGDDEWDARIAAHRLRRPAEWVTVEEPDLVAELARPGPLLVDDLATWLTGVLDDASAWTAPHTPASVDDATRTLVGAVRESPARVVLVSAEVGLGIVPDSRSGRLFRDGLGSLNAELAEVCEEVVLVVAGLPLRLR